MKKILFIFIVFIACCTSYSQPSNKGKKYFERAIEYNKEKDTINAVKYIKKNCDIESYKIVIVDNASPNDSYQILQSEFQNDEKVVLIKNQENCRPTDLLF